MTMSGTNRATFPTIPGTNSIGENAATVVKTANTTGALDGALQRVTVILPVSEHVLADDDRVVDDNAQHHDERRR